MLLKNVVSESSNLGSGINFCDYTLTVSSSKWVEFNSVNVKSLKIKLIRCLVLESTSWSYTVEQGFSVLELPAF